MKTVGPVGTCFGFELVAADQVWLLREGSGTPLQIEYQTGPDPGIGSLVTEWVPNDRNPIEARLYEATSRDAYALSVAGAGWYFIDPPGQKIVSPVKYDTLEGSIRLLGLPLLLCCLARGDTTLHAAAVEVSGTAILLAAPGRHGKTSLSASFAAAGHRLLSEDLSCLRSTPAGIELFPGPTGLRVRPDMSDLMPLAGYEEIGLYGDRIVLRPTGLVGDCSPVRVAGVVFLSDFGPNLELLPVDPGEAVRDLWFLSFHLPNDVDRARKFQALVDLVGTAPAWRFVRPPDRTRLKEHVDHIVETVVGGS
jgi:hypothetical protein